MYEPEYYDGEMVRVTLKLPSCTMTYLVRSYDLLAAEIDIVSGVFWRIPEEDCVTETSWEGPYSCLREAHYAVTGNHAESEDDDDVTQ